MYKREMYLRRIRPFYKNEQIKVLSGVRRAGKTEILKMIQEEVRTSSDDAHIVYLSFELLENKVYRVSENLYSFIESKIVDEGFYYIFLDEIQFVEDWPEVVNSIKTKYRNVSIFLTGSNSKLLDDDKESILGGRTISFRIMPFTFAEFHEFRVQQGASQDPEREFTEYMKWGGFPLIFAEQNDSQKQIMLESIFDSIVLRDIVRRKKLKSSLELEHLIDYLIASSSSYISGRNVSNRLMRSGTSLSLPKILEFIKAADESCIVDIVPRYDVVGLQTVEFNNKSYTCDPAFINYKKSLVSDLYGVLFETIVYNDLIARGYTVRTGFAHGKEIDFIATKGEEKIYIQAAYLLSDEKVIEREFGAYEGIGDNYPKYVISMDRVPMSRDGIIHMSLIDFLLQ